MLILDFKPKIIACVKDSSLTAIHKIEATPFTHNILNCPLFCLALSFVTRFIISPFIYLCLHASLYVSFEWFIILRQEFETS